ncbi:MAG: hypothetical protein F6K50_45230 [Moorea sp. SIO3I7]|uniref:hypothetical protein n=1 Tax=Moorena sp. SIO4A5 TaxID=2607838 RepID=UPI0013C845B2|nr:hypothetical protein [Moorena sp. SIO4A5]NEO02308.1 hypothetical protein [Moorena sp. SIO3I7]NEO24999.1 hypothetical protein [Moorena sp. SIO4A5]
MPVSFPGASGVEQASCLFHFPGASGVEQASCLYPARHQVWNRHLACFISGQTRCPPHS